jgi:hypothetical protein
MIQIRVARLGEPKQSAEYSLHFVRLTIEKM